jgi:ABC-type polysaccharide/polyol phosphate export permease
MARPAALGLRGGLTVAIATYDLRRRAEVFVTLVERDLRLRSKRATMGVVWPVIAPLMLLGLYAFVFGSVLDVPIGNYPEFLFAGLLPWSLLALGLGAATTSLSTESELIRRSRFAYELLPMATVGAMTVHFGITLTGFVLYLALAGDLAYATAPLVVVPTVALVLFAMSIASLLALVDVYNRDLRHLLGNILTVWFFLLPIVYRQDMLPASLRPLRSLDPMSMIVEQFRAVLLGGYPLQPGRLAIMIAVCAGLFAVCVGVFRMVASNLPGDV